MTFRERVESVFRLGLLVFVLAAAAFLSAVMAMRFAIQGREVTMPSLVGKNLPAAQALLQDRGLQMKIADRVYSELPENAVVRQSPPAGEHMKVSQDTHVVLSLGPQNVTIPALAGESLRIARIHLLQAGLQLGELTFYETPELPADTVIQQNPAEGTRAASPRMDLLVSQAAPPPDFVMPWLVGMPVAEATRQMAALELKFAKITYEPLTQWPAGTITEQRPDRGSKIDSDTPIEVTVAE